MCDGLPEVSPSRVSEDSDAQLARAKDWHVAADAHSTSGGHVYCADCTVERDCLNEQRAFREPAGEESNKKNHCSERLPGIEICQCTHRSGERMQSR